MLYGIFCKSATYVKGCRKIAKKCFMHLVGNKKSSTFAPAIERDAVQIEILKQSWGYELPLQKKLFEKNFEKVLVVQKNSLPLHPLSKR